MDDATKEINYSAYEQYVILKRQHGYRDECDSVLNLFRKLQKIRSRPGGTSLMPFDNLAIDEVQSCSQATQLVLMILCKSVQRIFLVATPHKTSVACQ
jgi:hypothetical protein